MMKTNLGRTLATLVGASILTLSLSGCIIAERHDYGRGHDYGAWDHDRDRGHHDDRHDRDRRDDDRRHDFRGW